MTATEQLATTERSTQAFRYAALAYTAGLTIHTLDHLRRGTDAITPQVFWLGILGSIVAVAAILAILAGHRRAPELAVFAGFSQAVGVILVHFGPPMGAFSDPLLRAGLGAGSATAALLEVAGALAAGLVGARILRRSRRDSAPALP